ncbi:DUF6489 family protein [Sphingosinicella soli]|uniref:Uncharacterized protein n=1 Tax=Sphingosinicella soli TaxID=333708 RepID=A0A7W7B2Y5_9SPHN|nr:DUF6489 family protein [Sphingosinicella soli]MBB4633070.1 hypothetical protein [Sphingosinicella soli]
MKVNIEIDCTPEEARTFMGLPDVGALHDIYIDQMKSLMKDGITASDVERLMSNWMPSAASGFGEVQKAMWNAMTGAGAGTSKG